MSRYVVAFIGLLVIFQIVCLALVTFSGRSTLGVWSRGIVAMCAVVVLATNTLLRVLLFMPRVH